MSDTDRIVVKLHFSADWLDVLNEAHAELNAILDQPCPVCDGTEGCHQIGCQPEE